MKAKTTEVVVKLQMCQDREELAAWINIQEHIIIDSLHIILGIKKVKKVIWEWIILIQTICPYCPKVYFISIIKMSKL